MTPVYANGLSDEAYWQMVEKMMSVLTTFNSLRSGWTLEKVLKVDVKFARFRPILGSSYIALPSKIANCRGLLNVRNHEDRDCFRYCFVAAYYMYHQISLDRIDRNYQSDKTSPTTYNQPGLHQPLGDFTMPMGFADIPQFETLNNVQVKEIHEPCGFALTVIDHHSSKPIFHHVDSSPACMTNFVKMLHKLARDIYQQKRKHPFFKGDRRNLGKSNATHFWICEKSFSETEDPENTIDLDHCHYSGKFLGWAHEKCNRLRRNINFTPVVGHNIQNYDLHHICLALNNCEPTTTISLIPATDKKYISMTFGVLIDTFVTEKGKTVKVYEYLRFIDSFKMMNSSLEKLFEILPDDRFEIMRAMFSTLSDANLQLLKQKGYYPYSYVTGRSKFSDTSLPPLSKWGNTLDGAVVKVTETNLQHARRMWEILECGTLQDYHDSYLKLDCALLACVCEFHRQLSFDT
ncbi:uncharacterized protein LOC142343091 [Convolutriloba macropyga]|uniref:uncharacterized protein LOC142343091 n=1 Tax=Convolutriloba macropyga TaxID=536237 RepID=UPI003F51AFC5